MTLAGNAIMTVTDKNVADSFRQSDSHYVSANANGTYSIMLKSAFRVFITVVDGEPRIGFPKDTARATKYKLMGKTALDDGSDWAEVSAEAAAEVVANPFVPLYWAKPAGGYRFFKVVIAE